MRFQIGQPSLAAVVFVVAVTSSAIALSPALKSPVGQFKLKFGLYWTFLPTPDGVGIASVIGRPTTLPSAPDMMADLLFDSVKTFHHPGNAPLLFDDRRKTTLGDTSRYVWDQKAGNERVENAYVLIAFDEATRLYNITLNTVVAQQAPEPVRIAAEAEAIARAEFDLDIQQEDALADAKHIGHLFDRDVIGGDPLIVTETRMDLSVRPDKTALLAVQGIVHRVYHVQVRAFSQENARPLALREYAVDATTPLPGPDLVLRTKDLMPRMSDGYGRVFDPNPENTLNDKQLLTHPPDPNSKAYFDVMLCDLNDPVSGKFSLNGPYVRIEPAPMEAVPPVVPVGLPHAPVFRFNRGSPDFAAVMVYFHIDRLQRYFEDLNLGYLVQRPLIAYFSAGESTVLDAGYSQSTSGQGSVWFSNTTSVYAAEDADVITHEYGHAILEVKTNERFRIADNDHHPNSEAGAIGEGFADYLAYSASYQKTTGNTFDLNCFAEWGNGGPCFRTYRNRPSHKSFVHGDRYASAEIWSGTLVEIFDRLNHDREKADWLVVKGQLANAFVDDAPTMKAMADGILIADGQKYGGADRPMLCEVFEKHDIGPLNCCPDSACTADHSKGLPPQPTFQ